MGLWVCGCEGVGAGVGLGVCVYVCVRFFFFFHLILFFVIISFNGSQTSRGPPLFVFGFEFLVFSFLVFLKN